MTERHNDIKTKIRKDNKKDSEVVQANSNELIWTEKNWKRTKTERQNDNNAVRQKGKNTKRQ